MDQILPRRVCKACGKPISRTRRKYHPACAARCHRREVKRRMRLKRRGLLPWRGNCRVCRKEIEPGQRLYCREHSPDHDRLRSVVFDPPATVPKTRRCVACGKNFYSEGPWNRVCPRCSKYDIKRVVDKKLSVIRCAQRKEAEASECVSTPICRASAG